MTTAYHNVGITSAQITALMRRINALEEAGKNRNMGVELIYPPDATIPPFSTIFMRDWRIGEDGNIYVLYNSLRFSHDPLIYVQKYNTNAELLATFGNFYGTDEGQSDFTYRGITADSDGNFFICNRQSSQGPMVLSFSNTGEFLREWEPDAGGEPRALLDIQCRGSFLYCLVDVEGTPRQRKVLRYSLTGTGGAVLVSVDTDTDDFNTGDGLSVHESGYFWLYHARSSISDPGKPRLYDASGDLISVWSFSSILGGTFRVPLGIGNTFWIRDSVTPRFVQYDLDQEPTGNIQPFSFDPNKITGGDYWMEDESGKIHAIISSGGFFWAQYGYQTYFNAYDPEPVSLGAPDGGVSIPALDGLSVESVPGSKLAAQIIEDMRNAIEALASFYENAVTGDPFNWTNSDEDNLYSIAVDTTDYGDTGTQYDWHRTKAQMYDKFPVARDIGEIEDCVTLLEASDLVT
jgi:hypothetical protein